MLRRYFKKLVLAIVLSASLTFTACTPYEEDMLAAGAAGYVLGSYSYPRYTNRPYYFMTIATTTVGLIATVTTTIVADA